MATPVRIAQIGTGGFGNYHLKTWQKVAAGEVVGVYDVDPVRAGERAREYGIETVYRSLDELLEDPNVDAVTVVVPNTFHADTAIAVMKAGKACFCEKPLAPTAAEIERMIAARDETQQLLMTGQHMRFESKTRQLVQWLRQERLGDCYYSRARWLRRAGVPASPGFISKEMAVYGPMADIGVHVIDLAMFLLGFPKPVTVSGTAVTKLATQQGRYNGWGTFRPEDFEVEDFAAGWVRFDNGAVLTVEVSWALNQLDNEVVGLELFGDRGGARWPELEWVETDGEGVLSTGSIQSYDRNAHDGHANEFTAFCAAVRAGGPSPVPAEDSLKVAKILDGIYASATAGREVVL
jgi:predicted dehydrogenase